MMTLLKWHNEKYKVSIIWIIGEMRILWVQLVH